MKTTSKTMKDEQAADVNEVTEDKNFEMPLSLERLTTEKTDYTLLGARPKSRKTPELPNTTC